MQQVCLAPIAMLPLFEMRTRDIGRVAFWLMASAVAAGGACGGDGDDGGGSICDRGNAALLRCNLIEAATECSPTADGPGGECLVRCLESAPCSTLSQALCGSNAAPGADVLELEECIDRCWAQAGFQCASGDEGIDPAFACDGAPDCADGSDEVGCAMFSCGDETTVLDGFECDGFPDCGNGADEATCEQHVCGDGTRVPASFRCDAEDDCTDGSDEVDCTGILRVQCSAT
jgi:hypothetical protein